MPLPFLQIDAFTREPFAGNPAAVCLCTDTAPPPEEQMQQIAAEMNLSETAFLSRRPDDDDFDLRWFTPTQEVDLCGHATLASAHALWENDFAAPDTALRFHTRSGRLTARLQEDEWIALDFPAEPVEACDAPEVLGEAFGTDPLSTGRNRMDLLALFDDEETVRALTPDFRLLSQIEARGVIATAPASGTARHDFVSRFFAPRAGVPEDPVTGSAHCALAPFWAGRLGRERLVGQQVSARGGTVRCEHRGERVALEGQAVTVLRGELAVG